MINTIYSKQGYTILQYYTILYNTTHGWWVGVSVHRTNDTARAADTVIALDMLDDN